MSNAFTLDTFLFAVAPYLAIGIFLLASIRGYRNRRFVFSSLSSQFLENRQHFWGLVPLHYGIIVVLLGHLVAFLIPREIIAWNSRPLRLYVLEVSALAFGILTVIGLTAAMMRRANVSTVRAVTTGRDRIILGMLLVQAVSGVGTAILYPWGSTWYAATAVPYLRSLLLLAPDVRAVALMPWLVKLHILTAFAIIGYAPFTRLVHVLVAPMPYLWRKPQMVRWYRRPEGALRAQ
ncbi:MAG: respiratory nitrate reductase subunit gamma [Acidobacteria bacterium]|nr:respiratory nitrate reductase subunit gamma [Acidobacteriota bacterium]